MEGELAPMSGWLYKQSTGLLKTYRLRHFQLKEMVLSYKADAGALYASGVFDFNQVSFLLQCRGLKLVLRPLASQRLFVFKALCLVDAQHWRQAIECHLRKSVGFQHQLPVVSKRFWRFPQISEEEFVLKADTGDLLLFRSEYFASRLQRVVSGGEFDHVGLVLKARNGQIVVLEATSQDGVSCTLWNFEDLRTSYSRIAYRKLLFKRSQETLQSLEEFVQAVSGRRYHLTFKKLMCVSSERKGYFCSELVAAAYQHIGLLPKDPHASKYWPCHFSQSEELPLRECCLGSELLVVPSAMSAFK